MHGYWQIKQLLAHYARQIPVDPKPISVASLNRALMISDSSGQTCCSNNAGIAANHRAPTKVKTNLQHSFGRI
eukprot:4213297-Amphidinium_carterae.2